MFCLPLSNPQQSCNIYLTKWLTISHEVRPCRKNKTNQTLETCLVWRWLYTYDLPLTSISSLLHLREVMSFCVIQSVFWDCGRRKRYKMRKVYSTFTVQYINGSGRSLHAWKLRPISVVRPASPLNRSPSFYLSLLSVHYMVLTISWHFYGSVLCIPFANHVECHHPMSCSVAVVFQPFPAKRCLWTLDSWYGFLW